METTKYCYVNINKCIIRIVNCTNINDRHLERQLSRRVGYVLVIIFNAEGYLLKQLSFLFVIFYYSLVTKIQM